MKKKYIWLSCVLLHLLSTTLVFSKDTIDLRKNIIETAKNYLGVPYVWGGESFNGMDCSGFVTTAVREGSGISLPRTTIAIFDYIEIIPFNKAEPGDLLFFKDGASISHVGIFISGIEFIHSASAGPKTGVIISNLNENYWKTHFFATGRFLPATGLESNTQNNNETSTIVSVKPSVSQDFNKPSSPTRVAFTYKTEENTSFLLDIDAAFSYKLFNFNEFNPSPLGGNLHLAIRFLGEKFDFGVGTGILVEYNDNDTKIPLYVTFGFPFGFSFDIGSFFTSTQEDIIFDSTIIPFYANVSWKTPSLIIDTYAFSIVQNATWAGSLKTSLSNLKNNFFSGLSFSTAIRVSIGF